MARTVVAPDRVRWRVRRRWLPSWFRRTRPDWLDFSPGDIMGAGVDFADSATVFLVTLALAAAAGLLFLVIWPVVALAAELLVVLALLVAGLAGRVILRKPWTVSAMSEFSEDPREHAWQVVGWRGSTRLIGEVAQALEVGSELPAGVQTAGSPPRPLPGPRNHSS